MEDRFLLRLPGDRYELRTLTRLSAIYLFHPHNSCCYDAFGVCTVAIGTENVDSVHRVLGFIDRCILLVSWYRVWFSSLFWLLFRLIYMFFSASRPLYMYECVHVINVVLKRKKKQKLSGERECYPGVASHNRLWCQILNLQNGWRRGPLATLALT